MYIYDCDRRTDGRTTSSMPKSRSSVDKRDKNLGGLIAYVSVSHSKIRWDTSSLRRRCSIHLEFSTCLPADTQLCENILTFKRHLKIHLFKFT